MDSSNLNRVGRGRVVPAWQDTRQFVAVVDREGRLLYSGESVVQASGVLSPGCWFAKSETLEGARDAAVQKAKDAVLRGSLMSPK